MKKNNELNMIPKNYSNELFKDNTDFSSIQTDKFLDSIQAVEFEGANYYTPKGTITLPSCIDSAYANIITATDKCIGNLAKMGNYEDIFLPHYNYDKALELVANNVAITIISLYKRFIYSINNIIQDGDLIYESSYIINDIKNIILAFVMDAIDKATLIDIVKNNKQYLHDYLTISMVECVNGLGLSIYNDTLSKFTNKMYSNGNFDKEFVSDIFATYVHEHNIFMYDLTAEINPLVSRMLEGVNFITSLSGDK